MNGLANVLAKGCLTSVVVAVGLAPAMAAGPIPPTRFAILGGSSVYIDRMKVGGLSGDVGGSAVELTDEVFVGGNVIAGADYAGALELGDDSTVHGKCVTGGGTISNVPDHPAKCFGGTDISGTDELLGELSDEFTNAVDLDEDLSARTPTSTLAEIDVPAGTKVKMALGSGINIIAIEGHFLIGSESKLAIKAPAGASVVFLISGGLTGQLKGKVTLSGGIAPESVVYVVSGDVLLGVSASIPGTILAPSSSCLMYDQSKLNGALICNTISLSNHSKVTFSPLRADFP